MPWKKATTFSLTEKLQEILDRFSKSQTKAACVVERAKIVLLASKQAKNGEIAEALSITKATVRKWRNRFGKSVEKLEEIEEKSPKDLAASVETLLKDSPRPGAPTVYTDVQVVQIIDLACKDAREFGYEVSHWSLNLLVKEIKKQGIAEDISAKTVSRFLKYGRNKTTSDQILANIG